MRSQDRALERRHNERGTPSTEPTRPELVSMILGTFREMPGLCLHLNQAARLFGLRRGTCEVILEDLVAQGKLRRAADGQFVSAPARPSDPAGGDTRGTAYGEDATIDPCAQLPSRTFPATATRQVSRRLTAP